MESLRSPLAHVHPIISLQQVSVYMACKQMCVHTRIHLLALRGFPSCRFPGAKVIVRSAGPAVTALSKARSREKTINVQPLPSSLQTRAVVANEASPLPGSHERHPMKTLIPCMHVRPPPFRRPFLYMVLPGSRHGGVYSSLVRLLRLWNVGGRLGHPRLLRTARRGRRLGVPSQ